jgi:hypothetical protein
MTPLVEIRFGSHLFGTSTPESDLDLKAIHLPSARDLLLQRAKGALNRNTKADINARNTADDVDWESYSLQKYLALAAEGQTVALDMLFAPDWALTGEPHPLWREIRANRDRLITRRYQSFVGYCRTQANRYGIRGSRVAEARAATALLADGLKRFGSTAKLDTLSSAIERSVAGARHQSIIDVPSQVGAAVRHWEVCDRKMPYTASIKSAHQIMERVVAEYGHRALAAETNQGVDWKAVSHAVRIARQAIELLETGAVIFPRPEAAHLVAIKTGQIPYAVVAEEIDDLLPRIEAASLRSSLPASPDLGWIEDFVIEAHRSVVVQSGVRLESG